jgi:thiamine transport system ATP-binding protein
MSLHLNNVSVNIAGQVILDDVSLSVATHEIIALTGRSGSGKSTLLRVIAGIVRPTSGTVMWDEFDLTMRKTHERKVGMVFQDRVLFPHLDVARNIAFGLKYTDIEPTQRVSELLALVGLSGFEKRNVQTLSGGEAQRVALVRALAPRPRVLLLDEPLGALDLETRRELTVDLRGLLQAEQCTAIHVTHDLDEAQQVADRVVALSDL